MKKLLLPILLSLAGLVGGGVAGQFMKPPPPPSEEAKQAPDAAGSEKEGRTADPTAVAEAGHGGGAGHAAATAPHEDEGEKPRRDFVKLDRQFVVPVLESERVTALVVLSVAIEVNEGSGDEVFAQEPKLRDAFLRVLFTHAQSRGFDGDFTRESRLADLRGSLAEAAHGILGSVSHSVLLTNIVKQDV